MDSRFDAMSDEEVWRCTKNGDNEGIDYLLDRYKEYVRKKARSFYLIGGDNDDLIQEGMIGLMKAIRSFAPEKAASFFSFADTCITRQIYSAVKASQRKKHSPLNSYVSFYQLTDDDENSPPLLDTLAQSVAGPEDMFVFKERFRLLWHQLYELLSPYEREILELYLEGRGYAQIAERLNKDEKSIDNALQRIRSKASTIYTPSGTR